MGIFRTHTFRLRVDQEQLVYLIGDFNNWSTTTHPMVEFAAGHWQTTLSLKPGRAAYAYFVVDKRWEPGKQPLYPRHAVCRAGERSVGAGGCKPLGTSKCA